MFPSETKSILMMSSMSKPYSGPQHFSGPVLNKQPHVLGHQRKIITLKDKDKQTVTKILGRGENFRIMLKTEKIKTY